MRFTLRALADAIGGKLLGEDKTVCGISIDSRQIPQDGLYVAIQGDRFDGHDFCEAALQNGAAALVVEKDVPVCAPKVLVQSTKQALLDMARWHRQQYADVKLVGLTGSVGKTTTKEMTYAVLSAQFETMKTEGNLNNEIGMPKTLFRLDDRTQAAVIEMGMNHFGEIERMTTACRPNLAIITNIGVSHIEYLGSREGILQAKTEILKGMQAGSPLILNGDDDLLSTYKNDNFKLFYFGIDNPNVQVRATEIEEDDKETTFTVTYPDGTQKVSIPTLGLHNVYDALAAFSAGYLLGMPAQTIADGLTTYQPAGMRQRMKTVHGITVIEDCYNASPDSQKAALRVLCSLPVKRKIAVLGDMLELGAYTQEAHRTVGAFAAEQKVDLLFCYGEAAKEIAAAAEAYVPTRHFTEKEALTQALSEEIQSGDAVLFKASRGMALEDVIEKLYKEWNQE